MKRLIAATLLLTGCLKFQPPDHTPQTWQSELAEGIHTESLRCFCWWKALNDPQLNEFMRWAWLKNYDLLLARDTKEIDSCDVWTNLSADVAKTYVELSGLQYRLNLLDKNITTQRETVQLTKDLMQGGFVGVIDQIEAEDLLNQLSAQKSQIEISLNKTAHHLSILLGCTPGNLYVNSSTLPYLPCQMPIGCPLDFFERKFNIRKMMQNKAAMSLNKASQRYYAYEKAAIEALEQVENSLTALYYTKKRLGFLKEANDKSLTAYTQTYELYEKGLKSYLEVLITHRTLLSSEESLVEAQVQLLLNYIELYKTLS